MKKMKHFQLIVIVILFIYLIGAPIQCTVGQSHEEHEEESNTNSIDEHNMKVTENRLAAQLFAVLDHYKQDDPVGLPGSPLEDPMDIPDMKKSIGMANLNMMQSKAYGLSKFRIMNVKADLKAMKAQAGVQLDEMTVKGTYTLNSFFSKANGPYSVVFKNVFVKVGAGLEVEREGTLTTEHIKMDITFATMTMDFQNLGFLGTVFQNIVNSAPNLVFDAMKPFMLQEADKKIRHEINGNIVKLMGDRRLPNSITPLDMAIAEFRKKIRNMGYDPYHVPDYNRTAGIFTMQLSNTWIMGVSSIYRVGDMVITMENNTVHINLSAGTQQISGAGQWEVGCGLMSRVGHVQFTVQHIRVTLELSQPLDTRKHPQINDLQFDLGNIQVRCDGAGTLDYIMEFVVNVLPNLLRYQIMDALENPIKMRLQETFNTIDVEKAIKENFDKFEMMGQEFAFDFKI